MATAARFGWGLATLVAIVALAAGQRWLITDRSGPAGVALYLFGLAIASALIALALPLPAWVVSGRPGIAGRTF